MTDAQVDKLVAAVEKCAERLDAQARVLAAIAQHFGVQPKKNGAQNGSGSSGRSIPDIAPDRDIDGQYGDPKVAFKPRNWEGTDYKGSTFSQCPADFLDEYAAALASMAGGPKDQNPERTLQNAARARGWAARKRKTEGPPPADDKPAGDGAPLDL